MSKITYDSALVIGMGLIGSSIARALKEKQLSKKIFAIDKDSEVISISKNLNLVDAIESDLNKYNQQFDIIFICTPLSSYRDIFNKLNTYITDKTLVTDVGSTKVSVIEDFKESINNKKILFVPAHPIACLLYTSPSPRD